MVPYDSLEALEAEIERVGAGRVAAVFVEPVIGAGGVRQPAPGYIEGVADLCARTGVLFVCDSVIAGFGRLGTWFGIERWDVEPDMITFAKGVTSGYLPLGGVVVGAKVAAPFWEDGAWFRHGPTYSGHPTVCAAAMANLDIIEREGLLDRARELEDEIASALRPLGDHRWWARSAPASAPWARSPSPPRGWPRRRTCRRASSARCASAACCCAPWATGWPSRPPLVITREQVDHVAEVAGEALEAVARDVPEAVGAR